MISRAPVIRLNTLLFLMIGWSFFQSKAQSLPENVIFERLTIPGTIRSSQVLDLVQDKYGLIWLAGDRLFRYDGFKFRQYRELANGQGTLESFDIQALFCDTLRNRLLLATYSHGIVAYEYSTDQLTPFPVHADRPPILNQITQTSDGRIWAASFNNGLFYLDNDTVKQLADTARHFLHASSIAAKGSQVYVGVPGKIVVMENGEAKEDIPLQWNGHDLPPHTVPTELFTDAHNRLWIGTDKQGVLVYDPAAKKFTRYFPPAITPFYSKISRIREDHHGLIWILTKASGLVVYDPVHDKRVHFTKNPFSTRSISSDNCFSILEDRDGIIWIGATGDINKFDRHQIKFNHIYHNPLGNPSLTDNMVRGICEDHEGKIWIGTDGGYINILDPQSMAITPLKVELPRDSFNFVPMHFLELNNRRMLIGTSLGLLQYDRVSKAFSPFAPLWPFSRGRTVRQLLRHNNFLYFIHNGGLYQFDLVTHDMRSFREAGNRDAVNLTAMYLDREQRLWVGSSKGVSLFDERKHAFRLISFQHLHGPTQGTLLTVLSIHQAENDLYVCTFNGGLWRLPLSDLDHPVLRNYQEKDGLPSNTIYAALPDGTGKLWLSSNNGLARFEPSTGAVVSFSISEGLQEEEFNRLAYTQTRNGMMVFGGINGVNIFDPAEVKVSREEFIPAILNVSAFNPLHDGPAKETLYEHPEKLNLNYNNNFIRIDFFVPSYKFPKRYSVLYKLDRFENEWKEVFNENSATYSNLQPGEYTFLLKTRGINNEEHIIRLPIKISPPYWKAWWFILLSFCSVGLMVVTIILSYIRKARHDRQRLEQLLTIRTSEIEKSKEELQILNQKKDLIFSILSHDLRSPLTTLKGFLGYLIDHAHELSLEELKRHAINIKNSVTNSLDLIDNTLFWSLSQMGNIQYTPSTFALRDLVEKLHGLYQLTADKKRIPLTVTCPENILVHGDENMIYVALRNLVSNALKFTSEGNPVTIVCRCNEGFAEVKVTDKGIGMSQEYVRRVLSTDQPMLKKGTSNEKGTGLGLLLCKKFIELNKGALYVTSVEHIGTTFTVILPLAVRKPSPATV